MGLNPGYISSCVSCGKLLIVPEPPFLYNITIIPTSLTYCLALRKHSIYTSLCPYIFLAEILKSAYFLSVCSKYRVSPTLEVEGTCYPSATFGED